MWFFRCFWSKEYLLGWNLYLSIALSLGSVISLDILLSMRLFSLIVNVDAAFLRIYLVPSQSFSMRSIADPSFSLFENNGSVVFHNNLLSVTKDGLRLLKNRFFSFSYSPLQTVFCFLYTLKFFSAQPAFACSKLTIET